MSTRERVVGSCHHTSCAVYSGLAAIFQLGPCTSTWEKWYAIMQAVDIDYPANFLEQLAVESSQYCPGLPLHFARCILRRNHLVFYH
jgi:hypothetical protein